VTVMWAQSLPDSDFYETAYDHIMTITIKHDGWSYNITKYQD